MRIAVALCCALTLPGLAAAQTLASDPPGASQPQPADMVKTRTKSNNTNERVVPSQLNVEPVEPSAALKNRTKSNNANERAVPDPQADSASSPPRD